MHLSKKNEQKYNSDTAAASTEMRVILSKTFISIRCRFC